MNLIGRKNSPRVLPLKIGKYREWQKHYSAAARVTRFGEISPLWLYSESLRSFYLAFGKMLDLLWQLFYATGPIFTVVNGQILNN